MNQATLISSTALTPAADPFAATIEDLSNALKTFAPLVNPIDAVATLVGDIDKLLRMVGDLIAMFTDVDRILELLGAVLGFLSAVPIVGEIADVFAGLIEEGADALQEVVTLAKEVNDAAVKPVLKTLDEVSSGLGEIRTVIVDIGQKVPGYLNTVEILHYLSEIATPLVEALKGTGPADKLAAVLTTFHTVQTDVGKAMSALDPAIKAIGTAVGDISGVLGAISHGIGTAAHDTLAVLNGVANALHPISDGFHRLENAIKPLKWVLDALSCVFNKILKPVIDLILKATGLEGLVHKAEDEIFAKLGIKPVIDLVQHNVDSGKVGGADLSPSQGATTSRLWTATGTALSQYRAGDDSGTKAAVFAVISAIADTPIDPNKPAKAPPFPPDLPDLDGVKDSAKAPALYRPRAIRAPDFSVIQALKAPAHRPPARSLLRMAAAMDDGSSLLRVDPKDWPRTAALIASIETLVATLDQLAPSAVKLESALGHLETALALPGSFAHQVDDMEQLLGDCVHILDRLATLDVHFLTGLVAPFDEVARDQNSKMAEVTAALPKLQAAVGALDTAAKDVIAEIPDASVIETTLRRIEGWRLSIGQIVAMARYAQVKDAADGNAHKAEIDAFAAAVEASAADLSTRLDAISAHTSRLVGAVDGLQAGIDSYADTLAGISSHSQLLTDKALPVADRAVHVLGIVNGIVDPLAGLFQMVQGGDSPPPLASASGTVLATGGCVDAGSPMKAFGAAAAETIRALAQTSTKAPQTFAQFAEDLAEEALPLGQLASFVGAAASAINNQSVAAFSRNAGTLADGLEALTAELVETKSYETTIPERDGQGDKTITVANDLVDQAMLQKAQALLTALGLDRRTAGQRTASLS